MLELAVIGGGPSAVCVLAALTRRLAPLAEVSVTVFEPGPHLWRGRVFQPDGDEVLANVPMEDMSAHAGDAEHGVNWLHRNGFASLASDTAVPSRWQVGRYLEDTAEQAVAELSELGSRVRIRREAVTGLVLTEGRFWAHGDRWHQGPFDQVVLCVGGAPSYDHYGLSGAEGYVGNPYPIRDSLARVPANARVGVVGSGLTAIDVVMGLRARGHQGPVTLVSRNGKLPAVRRRPAHRELGHLTVRRVEEITAKNGGLTFDDVVRLATAELVDAGASVEAVASDLCSTAPAVRKLREDLARARECDDPGWSLLRDGMVACGQDAWYLLSDADKDRVRTHHQTLMRHCCPMPAANADRLVEMFDSGQLAVTGGVRSISPRSGGGFDIDADLAGPVDVVISASTPAQREVPPTARPLLESMRSQGLLVEHRFGGVRIDRTTSNLTTWRGGADRRLHALGDLTSGAYLFTFGMPVLAARADLIAHNIATGLQKGISRDHVSVRNGQGVADDQTAGLR
ncbi:Uncharacterized NAD(P)/FAD-binding protein YdhS [Lentzea fradiae]|uniref:Uncharacterized NAD(P)/FAD-binding protein YdhS n=1 Tax=Lentzea fradiae TaxID=200378 RepID=A0A1G8CNS2_9PSEU|nr:FAD/NAD(P)-binding protein [Lentzea fradiae]SDH46510.1 Uncharacterized NAD(P)/FAD-binding protein YdhS [Lentzea fradiae]